jgi:hypothetical protein
LIYQDFIAELRGIVVRQSALSDRLDTLFAEIVAIGARDKGSAPTDEWSWRELKELELEIAQRRTDWLDRLESLLAVARDTYVDPNARSEDRLGDMTLTDAAPDQSLADVDLEALDGPLMTEQQRQVTPSVTGLDWDSVIIDLGPKETADQEEPAHYVWPQGVSDGASGLSALDAIAADLESRDDPWSRLEIKDLRDDGVPEPLLSPERPTNIPPGSSGLVEASFVAEGAETEPPDFDLAERSVDEAFDEWLTPQEIEADDSPPPARIDLDGVAIAVKLAIRVGDSLYTGFSTVIGGESIRMATEHRISVGEMAHLFLELPTGVQIGVNTIITTVDSADSGGAPYGLEARYLDLSEEAQSAINDIRKTL